MSDSKPIPKLSPTIATEVINRSPLHGWQKHYLLGGSKEPPNANMTRGLIIESFLFDTKQERLVIIEAADYRNKDAKALRDQAWADDKVPVLAKDLDYYKISADLTAKRLFEDYGIQFTDQGKPQVKLEWTHDGVLCKGKLDYFDSAKGIIYELKSTDDAHPNTRNRNICDTGQDIQCAAYVQAVETLYPALAGRVRFVWMYCEPDPPNAVVVAEPTRALLELGTKRWNRAVTIWGECLAANRWPSYSDKIVRMEPMPWQLSQEMDNQIAKED